MKTFNGAGGMTSRMFTLTVNNETVCRAIQFTNAPDVAAGSNQNAIAVGDFSNDSIQDFVSTANTTNNTISVRLGDGAGGFLGTNNYSLAGVGLYVAVVDFNGDGRQDLATGGGAIRLGGCSITTAAGVSSADE